MGPLSVVFSNIFLTKLENEVVKPINPRFKDDIFQGGRKVTIILYLIE